LPVKYVAYFGVHIRQILRSLDAEPFEDVAGLGIGRARHGCDDVFPAEPLLQMSVGDGRCYRVGVGIPVTDHIYLFFHGVFPSAFTSAYTLNLKWQMSPSSMT